MNRRGFLTSFAAVPIIAVTPAIAELLEPKRTIFLPPRGGWWESDRARFNRLARTCLIIGEGFHFTDSDPVRLSPGLKLINCRFTWDKEPTTALLMPRFVGDTLVKQCIFDLPDILRL